jgi:molecular chaperone DnaJ
MRAHTNNDFQDTGGKEHIFLDMNFSFNESVLGCDKTVVIDRNVRCQHCNGKTTISTDNRCPECNGQGVINRVQVSGNMRFQQQAPCFKCFQTGKEQKACDKCGSTGQEHKKSEFTVRVPAGVKDKQTITLGGAGHFIPLGNRYAQGNVYVSATVEKDPDMILDGENVISHINISLYDALTGVTRDVRTIDGYESIIIQPKTKEKDPVLILNKGLCREGNHVVIVHVDYPENVDKLIEVLKPSTT